MIWRILFGLAGFAQCVMAMAFIWGVVVEGGPAWGILLAIPCAFAAVACMQMAVD